MKTTLLAMALLALPAVTPLGDSCNTSTGTGTTTGAAVDGEACQTTGAEDWSATCVGDDLLYCVCDDWEGSSCPSGQGTWTRQSILCTCDEWFDGNCPIE